MQSNITGSLPSERFEQSHRRQDKAIEICHDFSTQIH